MDPRYSNPDKKGQSEFTTDEMLKNLESKLREDNEFLNKRINDIIEISTDNNLVANSLTLASLVNKFVGRVLKKQKLTELEEKELGMQVTDHTTLAQIILGQKDKDFYLKTLETVQSKVGILGKKEENRKKPLDADDYQEIKDNKSQHQEGSANKRQYKQSQEKEEEKEEFNFDQLLEEGKLSQEDQELLDLYGAKIRFLRWYFENDSEIKEQSQKKKSSNAFKGLGKASQANSKNQQKAMNPFRKGYANNYNFNNNNNNYYYNNYGNYYGQEVDSEEEEELIAKFGLNEDISVTYIEGIGYTALNEENSAMIESTYQEFLRDKKTKETYIQYEDDIYEIKFSQEAKGHWKITNTQTQYSRVLARKDMIKGPFIENKTFSWSVVGDSGGEDKLLEQELQEQMSGVFEKATKQKKDKCKFVNVKGVQHVFMVELKKKDPCLLLNADNHHKIIVNKKETVKRWDYLQSFKPPKELSLESGKICSVQKLPSSSQEYIFVSRLFLSTWNGQKAVKNVAAGIFNQFGAYNNNQLGINNQIRGPVIKSIEKIFNCVIYEKFMNEFKRMLRKYPQFQISDIMKHLFHGTSATNPKIIYESEDGLDIRFSNAGAYGQGIYFANNSNYSSGYAFAQGQVRQMFLAMVLVGDSVQLQGGQYRIPPNKPGSQTERYDSINNGNGGHYIIYDNTKSYPGYLITF